MLTRLAAQALTDGFAALALGAVGFGLVRRGRLSPLETRLAFMFGGLCFFFGARAVSELTESSALVVLTQVVASMLPVAGLVLAEGLLRRHAPRALKVVATLGAVVLAAALIVVHGAQPASSWGLGGFVLLTTFALIVLLVARDRPSLSQQENAGIDALMLAGVALIALSLTDFLPQVPVGMGGVGAAVLAYCAHLNPTSPSGARRAIVDILVIALVASVASLALAYAVVLSDGDGIFRLSVVMFSVFVAVLALRDAFNERAKGDGLSLREALVHCDTSSLTAFFDSLAEQASLHGVRLAEGPMLAEYDAKALGDFLAREPVWTRARAGVASGDEQGRDQLLDLMARTQSSHALLISATPLRVALLTLPEMGDAGEAEMDLALFGKLAALAAAREA